MPWTTRADGDGLTASSHNANCRDQVISTVTSATRPAGTEGQVIYETDTDLYQAHTGSTWIPFGGLGAWTTYTPTLTQSVAVTKTISYARYNKIGRTVHVQVILAATSAGTANNAVTVSLPFTAAAVSSWCGQGVIYDASAGAGTIYPGLVIVNSSTTIAMTDATAATTVNIYSGQTGATFAAALASGDLVAMSATYEATS